MTHRVDSISAPNVTEARRWQLLTFLSISLIFLSVLFHFSFPTVQRIILRQMLKFAPGMDAYEKWRVNDDNPLLFELNLFNWTNSEDLYSPDVKPRFEEVGPYRYTLNLHKKNVRIHGNGTVTYNINKIYKFLENESASLDEVIVTPNQVANTVAYKMRHTNYFTKAAISMLLSTYGAEMTVTKTARELLFGGYHDNIIDALSRIPFAYDGADKIGFFYKKNNTDATFGPYQMHILNDNHFGDLLSYQNVNKTIYFPGKCGEVKGTTGEFSPIDRDVNQELHIFSENLCSVASFSYADQVTVKGILSNRYLATDTFFDNGTRFPDNLCYCGGECVPSGLLNMSTCHQGAPLFYSYPHFGQADSYYTNAIDGMQPNMSKFKMFATYEPVSGVITEVLLNIQVNVLIQPIEGIAMYENVPRYFLPVFRIRQRMLVSDEVVGKLKLVQDGPKINSYVCASLLSVGLCLAFLCIVKRIRMNKSRKVVLNEKPMVVIKLL